MEQQDLHTEPEEEFEEPEEQPSPFERFADVFTAPARAFAGLLSADNRKAIILWGMLLGLIGAVVTTVIMDDPEIANQMYEQAMEPLRERLDEGKIEKKDFDIAAAQIEGQFKSPLPFRLAFTALFIVIFWLLAAVVCYIVCRILEKEHDPGLTYGTALAVMVIAGLTSAVGQIINAILIVATKQADFSLSLAKVLDSDNGIVAGVSRLIDPFFIWWMVVTGIGVAVVTRVSRGKGIGVVVGVTFGLVIVFSGLGMLLGSLIGG